MSEASDPPPPYQSQDPVPTRPLPSAQRAQSTFYHVYRSRSGNYRMLLDNQTPSFYIKNRIWRTPDLIVHQGDGEYDREVANCKFPEFGNYFEMNMFREANNPSSSVQTKMSLDGRFIAIGPVPDSTGATISAKRSFGWKQASSLMLIDGETSQTAAVIHGIAFGLKKCFVLEIQAPCENRFEALVVTSAMVIYESQRREYSNPSKTRRGLRIESHAAVASNAGFAAGAMRGGSIR